MEEIRMRAEHEVRSTSVVGISMALLLRARAPLKTQGAAGPDGVPCEILRRLPWSALRSIQKLFDKIIKLTTPYPQSWRQIFISFMPKIPGISELKDGRLLCMQNAEHRRAHGITASLKHIGQHAAHWGNGETAHLANADVLQAFDHCT
eukprot:9502659-Pyramimonas_sp.AAC.1